MTSVFSKILEYCILDRLNKYLNTFDILSTSQHGFRVNFSTNTALNAYYNKIVSYLNNGKCSTGIFCDLSRAFDCVNHTILLSKLESYGIRGNVLMWFSSYLTSRYQYVEISKCINMGNHKFVSSKKPVVCGIPQGSILGPVLFSLFINDLPLLADNTGCTLVLYADDTSILMPNDNMQNTIFLENISKWFAFNGLLLNDKTKCIYFHTAQKKVAKTALNIGTQHLEPVNNAKILGICIEEVLNWNMHCTQVIKKINIACYQIRTLKYIVDLHVLLNFYYAHVHSRLSYGISLWGSSPAANEVFKAQKRIIRNIVSIGSACSCKPHFKKLKILTLPSVYILTLLVYTFQNRNKFILNKNIHEHNTRNTRIYLAKPNLELYRRSPNYLGPKLFNALPDDVKSINNVKKFCRTVKTLLLEKACYSVDDFLL